jgi:hypothetical protein
MDLKEIGWEDVDWGASQGLSHVVSYSIKDKDVPVLNQVTRHEDV